MSTEFAILMGKVVRWVVRKLRNREDVKDVMQEIWLALRGRDEAAWSAPQVWGVVHHKVADRNRHKGPPSQSLDGLAEEPSDRHQEEDDRAAECEEKCQALRDALAWLRRRNPAAHALLWARYFEGRSVRELAEAQRVTRRAIRHRLDRIRAKLRVYLQRHE